MSPSHDSVQILMNQWKYNVTNGSQSQCHRNTEDVGLTCRYKKRCVLPRTPMFDAVSDHCPRRVMLSKDSISECAINASSEACGRALLILVEETLVLILTEPSYRSPQTERPNWAMSIHVTVSGENANHKVPRLEIITEPDNPFATGRAESGERTGNSFTEPRLICSVHVELENQDE